MRRCIPRMAAKWGIVIPGSFVSEIGTLRIQVYAPGDTEYPDLVHIRDRAGQIRAQRMVVTGVIEGDYNVFKREVYKTVELIKAKGGKVSREPGPVKGGNTVIAFVEDPDGYKFELIQRGPTPEPLCQVMLRVGDLERSIEFYQKAFGMQLLRTRDNPEYKYTLAMLGYGPEDKSTVMELTYNYGVTKYEKGNGYAQVAIGTDDVYTTAEVVREAGGKITREPGPLPGINTKIVACLDPDGWKTVFSI
ncbi:hypothetical protein L7F22_047714 [Adiantum nelumboides]|nr:hypothetical protein [Adiantum nelumboides]